MKYTNVGAVRRSDGSEFASKKALKEAVAQRDVWFATTSMFDGGVNMDAPRDGETLQVCGPNPYNKRRWYASVTRNAKGELKVD